MASSLSGDAFRRPNISYENKCIRFINEEKLDYERQFNDLYRARLDTLRPRIIEAATKKWGSKTPIRKLTDLYDNKDKCVIIGTIYKMQALKPSVLKELADEASVTPQPIRSSKYAAGNDKCILEDENLRVNLSGPNIDHGILVTGVTLGVYGRQEEGGSFEVAGVCFAGPPQPTVPVELPTEHDDLHVLMLSGLNFYGHGGQDDARRVLYCRLLVDWITGKVGDKEELSKISRIVRVIIAGGSISEKCHCDGHDYGQIARYKSRKTAPPSVEAVRQLDDFLYSVSLSVDVDMMPGEFDPTNHMLPQQPLHKCVLPKSAQLSTLHQCTNPYTARIGGVSFFGTSGQNVKDILRYSTTDSSIAALECTLTWGHLCPSAPDTIDCYPYDDVDPFVLDVLPDIYFAGNQPELGAKLIEQGAISKIQRDHNGSTVSRKTLLLSLPKFSESGTCALVNLRTLAVKPIVFCAGEFFEEKGYQNGSSDRSIQVERSETPAKCTKAP